MYVLNEASDRGTIGANTILGDRRWAGDHGIDADFWAHSNCKVIAVGISYLEPLFVEYIFSLSLENQTILSK
jgi:hypothetical protein